MKHKHPPVMVAEPPAPEPEPLPETEPIEEPIPVEQPEEAKPQYSQETLNMLLQLLLGKEAKTAQKEADSERRNLQSKEEMRAMVSKFNRDRAAAQARCNHTLPDGRTTAVRGQTHNDGYLHPICVICQKEFEKRRPQGEEIETAVAS